MKKKIFTCILIFIVLLAISMTGNWFLLSNKKWTNLQMLKSWFWYISWVCCSLILPLMITSLIMNIIFKSNIECDNVEFFKHPFKLNFWKSQLNNLLKLDKIILFTMIVALHLLISDKLSFSLKIFPGMIYKFGWLFTSTSGLLFGPIFSCIEAFFVDFLNCYLHGNTYNFFISLSTTLNGFIYGLIFYRQRLNFFKILFAMSITYGVITVLINPIFLCTLGNATYKRYIDYVLYISIPKNMVSMIPYSIILHTLFTYLIYLFYKSNLIPKQQFKSFRII